MKAYPSCTLNSLASLSFGTIWAHVTNIDLLDDANNSLVDAKAQTDIIFHLSFITFLGRGKSIVEMSKKFNKNQLKDIERENESKLPVQEPLFELVLEDDFEWSPPPADQYQGVHGAGAFGPSSAMK